MEDQVILKVENINKSFPGVHALSDMCLSLNKGEVHALIGENGAGKSTLIKVLSGAYTPDSGLISFMGKDYLSFTPLKAITSGISVIYQELNLVPQLTVSENIFLGQEPMKNSFVDFKKMASDAAEILNSMDIKLNPSAITRHLSVAFQQLIEVTKSVARKAQLIIFDEPTSSLSNAEVEVLFRIIGLLKQQGVTMLYVSHRLEEVFKICDRASIMRDGRFIATVNINETSRAQLINHMVGRSLDDTYPKSTNVVGDEIVLRVDNLCGTKTKNVTFNLHKGEILGFAGLVGAGRTEMVRTLFGADKQLSGVIELFGEVVKINHPIEAIKHGVGFIPEDRKQQGLILKAAIDENIALTNYYQLMRGGFISNKKQQELVDQYIQQLVIKTPSRTKKANQLSGGNQQKVVLAKWLARECKILIFDEPTRGIDVGSKQEIYKLMRELCQGGNSIILISSEMPELLGMSDRIMVMHDQQIKAELKPAEYNQDKILDIASGGTSR